MQLLVDVVAFTMEATNGMDFVALWEKTTLAELANEIVLVLFSQTLVLWSFASGTDATIIFTTRPWLNVGLIALFFLGGVSTFIVAHSPGKGGKVAASPVVPSLPSAPSDSGALDGSRATAMKNLRPRKSSFVARYGLKHQEFNSPLFFETVDPSMGLEELPIEVRS
jgi:hypothetical protein